MLEEYGFWQRRGLGLHEAAKKMGVKVPALRRAIQRAKERADAGSIRTNS